MEKIPGLARSHPNIAALLLGAASAFGFQPLHLWPLGLAAMGAFGWLAFHSPSRKRALLAGWLFGVAHFTVTDNWIATAFTYQAEMPAILGWAAVPLLALYLAVWPAFATCAAWLIARPGKCRLRLCPCLRRDAGSQPNGCVAGFSAATAGGRSR